jgi:putative tryptophan/tyrosine transport system substrate-binding protein
VRRRTFIAGLGGAVAWPLVARAQQVRRVYRVGILSIAGDVPRTWKHLLEGLRNHGYVEGQNLVIEWRFIPRDKQNGGLNSLASWLD